MNSYSKYIKGNEEFVKRIYDQIDLMERRKRMIVTPFFSIEHAILCEQILQNKIFYEKSGGYEQAERVKFVLKPYDDDVADFNIVCLKATYRSKFATITHRDVLGAILHLGLEREKIGDIIIDNEAIYLFVDKDIENYMICNLTKIKRSNLHFKVHAGKVDKQINIIYQTKIVASVRLDVIVAAIVNMSRKQSQMMIKEGCVKVNHISLEETSYLCDNNSVISIRGYGRFHFKGVVKQTKKDRFVIEVGAYQ